MILFHVRDGWYKLICKRLLSITFSAGAKYGTPCSGLICKLLPSTLLAPLIAQVQGQKRVRCDSSGTNTNFFITHSMPESCEPFNISESIWILFKNLETWDNLCPIQLILDHPGRNLHVYEVQCKQLCVWYSEWTTIICQSTAILSLEMEPLLPPGCLTSLNRCKINSKK